MNDPRLYWQFQPSHYNLRITAQRRQRLFGGSVVIQGSCTQSTIQLNAHLLNITEAKIDGQKAAFEHENHDTLKLSTANLQPGEHVIEIKFDGKITDQMHGMYPCYFNLDGHDEELLATQFESHHAREVFPCIDEPEAKATFDLTLTTEAGVEVISNTPILKQRTRDDQLTTTFETTPVMSTYLLAWVVGKLEYQEATTSNGVTVRAYATPDKKHQLAYALDEAVELLDFYEDYFSIPYPLPKCDLIALPDFSSGAMENWGCITFRETALLADDNSPASTKQYITSVISHELAHQWFGNLVTMRWWDDLWLNESFANLMETYATDALHPEWDMWTQYFDTQTRQAFERDSLADVQKIQQEIASPAEIGALFDPAIVYAKGGSLLNMLHSHVGARAFRDGLRAYLKRHQYSNTTGNDLWLALSEASGQDIAAFMQPWITQNGLPVITITHASDKSIIELKQQRFYSNPNQYNTTATNIWPIPLMNELLCPSTFDQPKSTLQYSSVQLPLLNQGRKGYYICQYQPKHLAQFAEKMASGQISAIDRLGLLEDGLRISIAGLSPYITTLQLLNSYQQESSYSVWGAISSHIAALKMFAGNDNQQLIGLRNLVQQLTIHQHVRLGWNTVDNESHSDTLLRPLIIGHLTYSQHKPTVARLREMFAFANKPEDIRSDLRINTYAAATMHDSETALVKLLDWYRTTNSAEERKQIICGLAHLRDGHLIKQALDTITTNIVKPQDVIYWIVYLSKGQYTRTPLWKWMQNNWQWCMDNFAGDMHLADFPKYIASSFSTVKQLQEYRQFFEPKQSQPGLTRTIAQGMEDIESRIQWRQRDQDAVAYYLRSIE